MKVLYYLRCSTDDQNLDNQRRALDEAAAYRGWIKVGETADMLSGAKRREERPGLDEAIRRARAGECDVVAVWALDRLGRDLKELLRTVDDLTAAGVGLFVKQQELDTTTPTGRFTLQILGAVAELERSMIRERTKAGLRRTREQGRTLGKPSRTRVNRAVQEMLDGLPLAVVARKHGVREETLSRWYSPSGYNPPA